jgi:HlyD family secretion protein
VDWLKPGMTAKVEVLVDRLPDVVYVPVQAVTPQDGHQVCHVIRGGSSEPRTVEIGQFNDEFVEIKSGLKAGEKVLLRPPDAATRGGEEKPKTAAPPAKAAAAMKKPE